MVIASLLGTSEREPQRYCLRNAEAIKPSSMAPSGFYITFKFKKSVGDIFELMTHIPLRKYFGVFGVYYGRYFKTKEEVAIAQSWVDQLEGMVFLNDTLDCSLALGMYKDNPTASATELGVLKEKSKLENCTISKQKILKSLLNRIKKLPLYNNVQYIAAVPRSTGKPECFSEFLANEIAKALGKQSLVPHIRWGNKTKKLRELPYEQKEATLEESNLQIDNTIAFNKGSVLLIDDLYQSGITMQHVAKKLRAKGAQTILGFAVVKSLSNDDNTPHN